MNKRRFALSTAAAVAASVFALQAPLANAADSSSSNGVPGVEMNVGSNASDRGLPGVEMNIGKQGDQKNIDTRTLGANGTAADTRMNANTTGMNADMNRGTTLSDGTGTGTGTGAGAGGSMNSSSTSTTRPARVDRN